MPTESIDTLVIGAGQAGLAMSEHLGNQGIAHLVLERSRIAERWRTERWDSLVANGPAWHDRFPTRQFRTSPDDFPTRENVIHYLEEHARAIDAPVRCGVEVTSVREKPAGSGFAVQTSAGTFQARNVVAATGPFQRPLIPPVVPQDAGVLQIHSNAYRNPGQLPAGGVLVIGAGSSGSQIADELLREGRPVYLSIGPHDRPPRRYRGKDYCHWLGVLGKWDAEPPDPSTPHVTIAVSGAYGGHTVDFRRFAERGMTLLGMSKTFEHGVMHFADDLQTNVARGDANLISLLREVDDFVAENGLDLPEEPDAYTIGPDSDCLANPLLRLDLAEAGIETIIWATGYALALDWIDVDVFDDDGRPRHERGVSVRPGLYFLGLPWLSCRGSSFIWGVWPDARYLADHIAARQGQDT